MSYKKIFVILLIAALILAYWLFDLNERFSLVNIQARLVLWESWVHEHYIGFALGFFCLYIAMTALSLPGATILTLVGGYILGFWLGLVLVSFASTIGACCAFLLSRYVLRSWVEQRFSRAMKRINDGVERDGAFYLLSLRLMPAIPYFVINLVMGVTRMRLWTFYWLSQVGMLLATAVYVNAGSRLGNIQSFKEIASPSVVLSLAFLALLPWLAKWLFGRIRQWRKHSAYPRPKRFDFNLIVIGAGSAGLVAAYIASTIKAKVALIEKDKMGGDCLNTGCVPSKALIRAAKSVAEIKKAGALGVECGPINIDFKALMKRVQATVKTIEPHDSVDRYQGLGVDCISGSAYVESPYWVRVGGQRYSTKRIIIASGAKPRIPEIPGLKDGPYLSSDNIWTLEQAPKSLLVLGGGPIGCELAQAFARIGSKVTLVERGSQLLKKEDPDVAKLVLSSLIREDVQVLLEHEAQSFEWSKHLEVNEPEQTEHQCICLVRGEAVRLNYTHVLVALGRQANTQGFGLDELGVQLEDDGRIATDEYLQSSIPGVYASGDVTSSYQFTHAASHLSWYACVNALLGFAKKWKVDYGLIPRVTYTSPEIASVGLNEQQAKAKEIAYECTRFELKELDRAIIDQSTEGFIKVLTKPGKDKILGVTIVSEHAGEMLAEFVLAMKKGHGLNLLLSTIHAYPSMVEANKYVAGQWKRDHAPQFWLARAQSLFTWLRS